MSWYWWVLVWVLVLIVTFAVLLLIGRSLYRKASALFRELSQASERLAAVSATLQELAERPSEPAVFTTASQLRQEQILGARHREGRRSSPAQIGQKPQPRRRSTQPPGQRVR